jgi:NAD(P)-dependent dehydrogenase (short-subunit alcohol dehydrogenase family)
MGLYQNESEIDLFDSYQDRCFYSMLYLAQALGKQDIGHAIDIAVISNRMQSVTGKEEAIPYKATLLGLCKVVPQEFNNIICRVIDVEFPETSLSDESDLADQVIAELSTQASDAVVAYRGGHRWVQSFEPIPHIPEYTTGPVVREKGVFLITGGLGKLGLVFAQHLAEQVGARLALVGHSTIPDRRDWDQWLATHNEDDAVSLAIKKIGEIEALGGKVEIFEADVANQSQMQSVVASVTKRFGEINGVIHAAGRTGQKAIRLIGETDRSECEQHFRAKVYGVMVLERVLAGMNLDFCILQSSLSCVLGGLGFAAYSAANHFMDAFAEKHGRASRGRWKSVNWDGWRVDEGKETHTPLGAALGAKAITSKEGVEALGRILMLERVARVAVSPTDLQTRIAEWIKIKASRDETDSAVAASFHPRRNLSNEYVAPRNETECVIANICSKLLGIEQVGIYDNFFEMGGHSLLAIQFIARLREAFHTDISLRDFFESPTVFSLARIAEGSSHKEEVPQSPPIARVPRELHRANVISNGLIALPESLNKKG